MKRLERSQDSRVIAGVGGGLGEYFNFDPVLFRIIFVILTFFHGFGILAYIVCWIAIPKRRFGEVADVTPPKSDFIRYLPGLALIFIGSLFLLDRVFWWFSFSKLWPIMLILGGVIMLYAAVHKSRENCGDECKQS
jgi:phage shock protein PspC (stress-responsive transcriptional regulator)